MLAAGSTALCYGWWSPTRGQREGRVGTGCHMAGHPAPKCPPAKAGEAETPHSPRELWDAGMCTRSHSKAPSAIQRSTHPCEAVPRPCWEVAADFGLSCLQHGGDEQPPTPQELAVHGPGVGVSGEPGEGGESSARRACSHLWLSPAGLALTRGTAAVPRCHQQCEPGGTGCTGRAAGSSGGAGRSSWQPGQEG